ncbi:hypothetical protein [Rugosimonospora africana]|uniref:Uncharacterized protein n=1 Tax=Rugosimonospora africana TaxID=556532 RepID=A0A8J3QNU1_9ACTN|nr:hypothetical protein [Rugosimonospora africana]GIH12952.1 hypothetical protein Raf01_11240 [Rugosimonospora africana]
MSGFLRSSPDRRTARRWALRRRAVRRRMNRRRLRVTLLVGAGVALFLLLCCGGMIVGQGTRFG